MRQGLRGYDDPDLGRAARQATQHKGPFLALKDGGILCIVENQAMISRDGGATWAGHKLFGDRKLEARPEQAMTGSRPTPRRTKRRAARACFTQRQASWFRAELSLAFSDDDGKTWTDPVVISRHPKPVGWLAYPHIYEREPGLLWITSMAGEFRGAITETDLVKVK